MTKPFLSAGRYGKNHWWRYGFVILSIILYWLFFSRFINPICYWIIDFLIPSDYLSFFISNSIPFILVLAILIYAVTKLHKRGFYSLINANGAVNVKRLGLGFIVWGLILVLLTIVDILIRPYDYAYNFADLGKWLLFLPFALILVPIQTSTEEFLFRGYLLQGLSLLSRNRLFLIVATGLLFAIPHFSNPEMDRGFIWSALTYFAFGIFFAAMTLKDNGLELALGVHAANNLFSFLLVNTPDSVLPSPSLTTYIAPIDPKAGFFGLLIEFAIFYFVFFGGISRVETILD